MGMGPLGWIAAALIGLPAFAALAATEQPRQQGVSFKQTTALIKEDFKTTFLRWRALPYTLMMVFPMASGAAIGLLPGIAQDYHVSGQQIAWMNGMAGAFLMAT